jgi:hypothetical protein
MLVPEGLRRSWYSAERTAWLLSMTNQEFKKNKKHGTLEGRGVREHRNNHYKSIWNSQDVYYILSKNEETPSVTFPEQARLYRVLATNWRAVVSLVAQTSGLLSSDDNTPPTRIPHDIRALWLQSGLAREVAAAMGVKVKTKEEFCSFISKLVKERKLTPPKTYPLPPRDFEEEEEEEDNVTRRSSTSFGRECYDEESDDENGCTELPHDLFRQASHRSCCCCCHCCCFFSFSLL